MSPNLHDRRVNRTRKILKEALIELVQEKGYPSVSIQDLTNRANLGKATFYLHYRHKDELLYECFNSVLIELTEKIQSLPHIQWSGNDPGALKVAFEFAAKNANFIKIMMHDQGGEKFFQQLLKIVADLIITSMKTDVESIGAQPVVSLEFLSNYYAGSILATIEWWIDNGMQYSIDEMVEMASKTAVLSRKEILGLTQ